MTQEKSEIAELRAEIVRLKEQLGGLMGAGGDIPFALAGDQQRLPQGMPRFGNEAKVFD